MGLCSPGPLHPCITTYHFFKTVEHGKATTPPTPPPTPPRCSLLYIWIIPKFLVQGITNNLRFTFPDGDTTYMGKLRLRYVGFFWFIIFMFFNFYRFDSHNKHFVASTHLPRNVQKNMDLKLDLPEFSYDHWSACFLISYMNTHVPCSLLNVEKWLILERHSPIS